MATKTVKTTRWTETDNNGRSVEVEETKTCGPVCKTVKVVGAVALAAAAVSVLASKK